MSALRILEVFTIIAYLGLGGLIVMRPDYFGSLPKSLVTGFGVLMLLYGLFRTWRFIRKIRNLSGS